MIRAHSGFRSRQGDKEKQEQEEEKRRQDKKEEVDFTIEFVGKRAELHDKQFNICKLIKVGSIYQRKPTRKTEGYRWLQGRGSGSEQLHLEGKAAVQYNMPRGGTGT